MATVDEGFAIRRNGSCLSGIEVDCGPTMSPFRGCCPTGYACPQQYNIACCPPGNNCTETLIAAPEPQCANATWDLFDNGGYFCCEHGLPGYNRQGSNGCAKPGASLPSGIQMLSTVRVGVEASASTALSSSASISSASTTSGDSSTSAFASTTNTPSPPAGSGSSTPVGAIAGGVVGGVVAIALLTLFVWWILRRRKQKRQEGNPYLLQQRHEVDASPTEATKYRMYADHEVHEVDGLSSLNGNPRELPAQQKPVELPAR